MIHFLIQNNCHINYTNLIWTTYIYALIAKQEKNIYNLYTSIKYIFFFQS